MHGKYLLDGGAGMDRFSTPCSGRPKKYSSPLLIHEFALGHFSYPQLTEVQKFQKQINPKF
jgi:hypothetical protein